MIKTVLIPVDIEHPESWNKPVEMAHTLFATADVTVHALYVLPGFSSSLVGSYFPQNFEQEAISKAQTQLAEMVAAGPEAPGRPPQQHVVHGKVYPQILAAADRLGAELIMLQAHRPGLEDYLLGSNAARIARHARQSVLLIRD